jgi:hypothetical protein
LLCPSPISNAERRNHLGLGGRGRGRSSLQGRNLGATNSSLEQWRMEHALSSPVGGEPGELVPDRVKAKQDAIYGCDQRPISRRCMRGSEESQGEKPEENALFLDGSDANTWHIGGGSPFAQSTGGLPLGTSNLELGSLEDMGTHSQESSARSRESSARGSSGRSGGHSGRSGESGSRTNSDRGSRTNSREFGASTPSNASGTPGTPGSNNGRSRGSKSPVTPSTTARPSTRGSARTSSPASQFQQNSPNALSARTDALSLSPKPILIRAASSPYLAVGSASHTVCSSCQLLCVRERDDLTLPCSFLCRA